MNVSQLKQKFVLGFECLCTHNAKGLCSFTRRVEKVQSNAVAMSGPDYGENLGWLYWPKASAVNIIERTNGVEIQFKTSPVTLCYEWLPAHQPAHPAARSTQSTQPVL